MITRISNTRKHLRFLSAAAPLLLALSSANSQTYNATAAGADDCFPGGPAGHVIYLPKIAAPAIPGTDPVADPSVNGDDGFRFVFVPDAGSFEINGNTATLTGHLESTIRPGYGFEVALTFTGKTLPGMPPPGFMPMTNLRPECYSTNGGEIDVATWFYFSTFTGTLTGTGNLAGAK